ncbi:YIP1 family protein [Oceanomicrobium pacificus]|uniref:Yip1 domain-containing protein n=1 Tax=Oceanomicrobium pacificus TaxID=2692916 RepID=A0A6B0TX49_9RHOB|nr:YIP1 family protein [Oceanomicrobium pacificus]MXU65862.1 hypothetical protein [Oceanomicrobium pacificus]
MKDILRRLFAETLRRPQDAAGSVFALPLERGAWMQVLVLVLALEGILTAVQTMIMPVETEGAFAWLAVGTLPLALIKLATMLAFAFFVTKIGRALAGTGTFDGALAMVAWLSVVSLALQVTAFLLFLLVPPLAALFILAGNIWMIWIYSSFTTALHGYDTNLKGLGVAFLTVLGVALCLSIFLVGFGLVPLEDI